MKHDAIVEQGIPIVERVPIPDEMIPADSRVEIDAKIQAGYCKSCPLVPLLSVGNLLLWFSSWVRQVMRLLFSYRSRHCAVDF